ncbi:hypothetical protein D9M70_624830 [compost metagenome]
MTLSASQQLPGEPFTCRLVSGFFLSQVVESLPPLRIERSLLQHLADASLLLPYRRELSKVEQVRKPLAGRNDHQTIAPLKSAEIVAVQDFLLELVAQAGQHRTDHHHRGG